MDKQCCAFHGEDRREAEADRRRRDVTVIGDGRRREYLMWMPVSAKFMAIVKKERAPANVRRAREKS